MSVLELKKVSYAYYVERKILDEIDMRFEKGKMYVILGPSGCGKTTLLSLIGGLDIPQEGSILFEGADIGQKNLESYRRQHVSFVFQNYNLIDYMTPLENVMLTAREDPVKALCQLGLTEDEIKRNVLKLSGGQQQRVAIARALASETPVILADEPTGNLDEDTAREITTIFKEAAEKYDRCVIVVTHSQELAKQAHERFELKQGKLFNLDCDNADNT
ncbi:putative ABC transport system ATP-binding protein [Sporobacter termitidis DSM 10068]|uniref:Putative ABC transport system ATP-binding protein n=1 Tax=Sporobacter termitidis DSM 10068 TaxID=1123282 RepID=A0A1M5W4A6_9FIRM|nr:ABC transporter ATP-binding protein [Sporobacter termitidis]SHH82305.1 putative ABC transport system ATP-binding protein [Sporobacter termitidis DSM 10068]